VQSGQVADRAHRLRRAPLPEGIHRRGGRGQVAEDGVAATAGEEAGGAMAVPGLFHDGVGGVLQHSHPRRCGPRRNVEIVRHRFQAHDLRIQRCADEGRHLAGVTPLVRARHRRHQRAACHCGSAVFQADADDR